MAKFQGVLFCETVSSTERSPFQLIKVETESGKGDIGDEKLRTFLAEQLLQSEVFPFPSGVVGARDVVKLLLLASPYGTSFHPSPFYREEYGYDEINIQGAFWNNEKERLGNLYRLAMEDCEIKNPKQYDLTRLVELMRSSKPGKFDPEFLEILVDGF